MSNHEEFYEDYTAVCATESMLRLSYCINRSLTRLLEELVHGVCNVLVRYILARARARADSAKARGRFDDLAPVTTMRVYYIICDYLLLTTLNAFALLAHCKSALSLLRSLYLYYIINYYILYHITIISVIIQYVYCLRLYDGYS